MNFFYSLRFRLYLLCLLSVVIPMSITIFIMSSYYQNLISNETKASSETTMIALTKNIETYLDDLERITLAPYSNQDFMYSPDFNPTLINNLGIRTSSHYNEISEYDKMQTRNIINSSLFNYMQNVRKDILCCLIAIDDKNAYIVTKLGGSDTPSDFSFSTQTWYKKAVAADGGSVFINAHVQNYIVSQQNTKVFSVARLLRDPISQRKLGVIMADADTVVLNKILENVNFNVSSTITIVDDNNNLIYSNHDISLDVMAQIEQGGSQITDRNEKYEVVSKSINRVNWKMVVLLSSKEIKLKLKLVYFIGFLFATGMCVFTFLLFSSLARLITKPFKEITNFIVQVEKGNLDINLKMKGRNEISNVAKALDNMVFQLNDYINREYKAALHIRNAELYALQSQINPHFLYNTLTGFLGLNRLNKKESLEKSIIALTGLMRYTLAHNELAKLSDEFLFLERYCSLQKLRFESRLEYNLYYDKNTAEYKIPKLILQPLVENSIIHGTEPLDGVGIIDIKAFVIVKDEITFLQMRLRDNGVGFDKDNFDLKKSVGLCNVKERLSLLYPSSTFTINSKRNYGTEIIIEIPEKDVK